MRPLAKFLGLVAVGFGLSGCAYAAVSGATWVGTEAYDDMNPFDYMAEFFERDCAHMSIYDQPPRCRR